MIGDEDDITALVNKFKSAFASLYRKGRMVAHGGRFLPCRVRGGRVLPLGCVLAAHFALAACQTSTDPAHPNIYGSLFGQGVVGNKDSVMISNVWNEMDAFQVAQRYCEQWGRNARFSYSTGYRAGFDCLP